MSLHIMAVIEYSFDRNPDGEKCHKNFLTTDGLKWAQLTYKPL